MPYVTTRARRRPLGSVTSALENILTGAGRALVQKVTIRSQFTPTFEFSPFASADPNAPPGAKPPLFHRLVKPEVTLATASGPIVVAPGGSPTNQYGVAALAAVGFFALVGGIASVRWLARRRRRA